MKNGQNLLNKYIKINFAKVEIDEEWTKLNE